MRDVGIMAMIEARPDSIQLEIHGVLVRPADLPPPVTSYLESGDAGEPAVLWVRRDLLGDLAAIVAAHVSHAIPSPRHG